MNDNNPDDFDDIPEWVWDVMAKHDLESDTLLMATVELLSIAAHDLGKTSQAACSETRISVEAKRSIDECKAMIVDAESLYPFCSSVLMPALIPECDEEMSDNDAGNSKHIRNDDLPKWGWDIIDEHGLARRASSSLDVAVLLLTNAASLLQRVCDTAFRECALSDEARRKIAWCKAMIVDAEKLFPLCPTQLDGTSATILPLRQNLARRDT